MSAKTEDRFQIQRIKAVFEKKNQKSAQVIAQLQRKLDTYQKRVIELERHGQLQSHRQPREVLRDMGQGLKWVYDVNNTLEGRIRSSLFSRKFVSIKKKLIILYKSIVFIVMWFYYTTIEIHNSKKFAEYMIIMR